MERFTNYQLFTMTFLYQLGTTIIFGFGNIAGRDAWIATLCSTLLGTVVIMMYIALMRMHPGLTLIEWFPAQLGRWVGTPISWLYPLLFLFDAGRVVGDLRDLIPTTLLPNTPPIVFNGLYMLVMAYALFLGIESLARVGETLFSIIMFLFLIEVVLLCSSKVIHLDYLLPLLEKGWSPIWEVVYPVGITQTYGESIVFAMIWIQTKNPERIMKITILSSLLSGIMLSFSLIFAISIFDEDLFKRSIYPLYTMLGVVNVGDFINNLSPFGVLYFTATAFFKMYIKIFAAITAIKQLTRLQSYRVLILPSVIIVLYIGMTISKNVSEHIFYLALKIVIPYIWVPLFLILPAMLCVVTWVKQRVIKRKE
ncbi:endospore germination permease [Bacillus sp. ISL-46]|uniref:GerAB/ArcD/ProY family transporter n=1 Tax=Bacillus sp. ISL-46 TaxID=2819129 RepID=UPI001BE5550A|nr:endospore germination permease [Bacillus sp. ISL-46]MBT2723312.1 endospore germination permease [Bacillus sp. ISL-46]